MHYPYERYLSYLTFEVPSPPRGSIDVVVTLPSKQTRVLKEPSINELPYVEEEFLQELIQHALSPDNLITVCKSILLDKHVNTL